MLQDQLVQHILPTSDTAVSANGTLVESRFVSDVRFTSVQQT